MSSSKCLACSAKLRKQDKFCPSCGQEAGTSESFKRTLVEGVPDGAARQWIGPGELFSGIEIAPAGNPDHMTMTFLAYYIDEFDPSVVDDVKHWDVIAIFASLGVTGVATIGTIYRDIRCPGTGMTFAEALDVFNDGPPRIGYRPGKNKKGMKQWVSAYATAVHFCAMACTRTK